MPKDINLLCYKTIRSLDIPQKERNQLLIDLFEVGFTKELKAKLMGYLDKAIEGSEEKIAKPKERPKKE